MYVPGLPSSWPEVKLMWRGCWVNEVGARACKPGLRKQRSTQATLATKPGLYDADT